MSDISLLASLLRQKGDNILNSESKLVLTDILLLKLNKAFESLFNDERNLNSSFHVLNYPPNVEDQLTYDIYFLYDFIQKTLSLKLTHGPNSQCFLDVDICQFKNLKHLELRKIPIHLVHGLTQIHQQLKTIICIKGIKNLEEFFLTYGSNDTNNFMWNELQEAIFSYNGITHLDTSLSYAPMLQYLDLSHNRITNAETISCLPNLRYLNMSYNLLESIPWINSAAFSKLQVLILKNNYIEDISALNMLKNITELDLTCNCLINHICLTPISNLFNLIWLSLEGNPLSFHIHHRLRCVQYLSEQIAFKKFILDRTLLTKTELLYVGANSLINSQISKTKSLGNSSLSEQGENSLTESSSNTLINSLPVRGNKKISKVRRAKISDDDVTLTDQEIINTSQTSLSQDNNISNEHLETKKQIETLRMRFGENNWLHSIGGSYVQDILGLPSIQTSPLLSSTPTNSEMKNVSKKEELFNAYSSSPKKSNDQIVVESSPKSNESIEAQNNPEEEVGASSQINLNENTSPVDNNETKEMDLEDETYLVKSEKNSKASEELFFIVTKSELKERAFLTGKIQERWPISTLLSCTKICNDPPKIHLTFDTIKKMKSERIYIIDTEEEVKHLIQVLGNILDSRSLTDMNQIEFKCIKCSCHFSKEDDTLSKKGSNHGCPTCGSMLIIKQDDEENQKCQRSIRKSKSPSSIGPNLATFEKLVVTALVHGTQTSNERDACSGQICSAESLNTSPDSQAKKYESDIEIISNPSQSSIEVLHDEFDRNNDSSSVFNKRQINNPILEKSVSETKIPLLHGLTESSSSESYTESICTAYENQYSFHTANQSVEEKKNSTCENSELLKEKLMSEEDCPTLIYTKMYEGLLETMNSKINQVQSKQEISNNTIMFSYDNYAEIDHRIKLYLILNVFDDEEEFQFIVKSKITMHNSSDIFLGCLIFSNKKIYIFKFEGEEGEDPGKWLKKTHSFLTTNLTTISTLPFLQGVILEFEEMNIQFYLLLQDKSRTNLLIKTFKENSLFHACKINDLNEKYEHFEENLLKGCEIDENKKITHFIILNNCKLSSEEEYFLELGALVITINNLLIFENITSLLIEPSSTLYPKSGQKMANLIEVTHDDQSLNLHYLDELAGTTESWSLKFDNNQSLLDTIQAIKEPWENLFLVPLVI